MRVCNLSQGVEGWLEKRSHVSGRIQDVLQHLLIAQPSAFRKGARFVDGAFWTLHCSAEEGVAEANCSQQGASWKKGSTEWIFSRRLMGTAPERGWAGLGVWSLTAVLREAQYGACCWHVGSCPASLWGVWQHGLLFPVTCQKWVHCFVNLLNLPIFVDALSSLCLVWPCGFVPVFLFQMLSFDLFNFIFPNLIS